jgi:hypothetical protein
MKTINLIVIALAAALSPAPAVANSAKDLDRYSACMLKRSGDQARQLLALPEGSEAEQQLGSRMVNLYARCLDDTDIVTPRYAMLRGLLAERLLNADAALKSRAAALTAGVGQPASGTDRSLIASYGACLATSDPRAALALIASERGSVAERDAMNGFGPTLKACAPKMSEFRVAISDTRDAVADALYQRAVKG